MMSAPRALVAGIHHWGSPFRVGTHYITEYLLRRGFEVAHISAPVTALHHLLRETEDLALRRENHAAGGNDSTAGLWHYVPFSALAPDNRPMLSAAWVARHWHRFSHPSLVKRVRDKGFGEVDLLLLDSVYQPFWLDQIEYRCSAYRLADMTAGFKGFSSGQDEVEREIIAGVDRVFCASTGLLDYARSKGCANPVALPNGIDLARFGNIETDPALHQHDPTAVYVGAFGEWFDHDLVLHLARARPELTIRLIGPSSGLEKIYGSLGNVKVCGPISPAEIPAHLAAADVGLIPFNIWSFPALINQVNPLKLYEYFAAGLPVVSTSWQELERLKTPAFLAQSRTQFVTLLDEVLDAQHDGSLEKNFVQTMDWHQTLSPLGDWLQSHQL